MSVSNNEEIFNKVNQNLEEYFVVYKQYLHKGICQDGHYENDDKEDNTCCEPYMWCIHASNNLIKLPRHYRCDCYYEDLEKMALGTVSERKPSPDVWLKLFGKLPDYYITKKEAMALGWRQGKDLSKFAPGKMIGGDIYYNKDHRLPEKKDRIWYECDINYVPGKRNSLRLYCSNDGLMFYSTDHGKTQFYWIK